MQARADGTGAIQHVLVVGVTRRLRDEMTDFLLGRGNAVTATDDPGEALTLATWRRFDAIVIERGDPRLPAGTLAAWLASGARVPPEAITTYAAVDVAAPDPDPDADANA